ncbi:nitrate ABC transporter permease [Oscillospiraceae bacterium]|nr:nitrate ABC transporter permease [Oscillospiraceae bacterium]BDF73921.1 nitrate ABC transporter permease [Oscillospiraceae bacterium]
MPLAVWLGVWQLAAMGVGKELLLPTPAAVGRTLAALAGTQAFWAAAAASLLRVFGGFAAGCALGAALAVLTSFCTWADWIFSPAVRIVRATPVASFILLVLLWAPTGQVPAIIAALMVLPVVWANVCKGIAQTDPLLLEAARAYRFSAGRTARLVYAPSALPYFAAGCSTGMGLAWKAGVAAEVLCQPRAAIGTQVYFSKIYLETPDLFAWTAVVIVLSLLLENALGAALGRMGRGADR